MELKNILTGVADRLSSLREERPSAGTKYRLMGVAADVAEVTEMLSKEVLERVKQEAVLDVDVDVDFDVLAEEVLSWELVTTREDLLENTQLTNDALGGLNDVLTQISSQLGRRHKLKKTVHKHYSELRKLVDYCDGCLVVNPAKVGRHFYTNRKEENARAIVMLS